MRIVILAAALAALATPALAQSSNNVHGYVRRDGTYVAPHYRTNPDSTPYNNYSTRPNVNPYTGQTGTREPSYGYNPPRQSTFGSGSGTFGGSFGSKPKPNPYGGF